MGNDAGILALLVEDDAIGAGTAAAVDVKGRQDGEFLPGARDGEVEALVVVVLVRVGVGPQRLARLVQAVALVQRRVDVRLPVARRAARLDARLPFGERGDRRPRAGLQGREREDRGEGEDEGGQGLFLVAVWWC